MASDYRAFLLRLWRSPGAGWRVSLEDPHTGVRRAFASVEQLSEYLAHATQSNFTSTETENPAITGEGHVE